jgi:hypothetical protein
MNKASSVTFLVIMALGVFVLCGDGAFAQGSEEKEPVRTQEEGDDWLDGFEEETSQEAGTGPGEGDEFLGGFEEDTDEDNVQEGGEDEKPSSWSLDGEVTFTTTYNFSPDASPPWCGFSMVRPGFEVTLKKKFSPRWQAQASARGFYDLVYVLRGRDDYTQEVLDDYENELEVLDTFVQGSLTKKLDVKIGRQIVVWGPLFNLRVTDILNPLDFRLPGLTDLDDLRLPVTMLKLDYFLGNWDLSGMWIPEIRFSKRPVFGSDFYPFPVPMPPAEEPDNGFEFDDAEWAAALVGTFSGWDIGFYWAYIYDDQAHMVLVSPGPPEKRVRQHARNNMLGTAGNVAIGNWLLKGEIALFEGLEYTNTPGVDYFRLDVGGGVEYSGFHETLISLEAVNRHIFDYNPLLELPGDEVGEDEFQWAFRFVKDFMNDTLTLYLVASTFGVKADDGAFERLAVEYDITDAVSVKGGVVFYQSGDKGRFRDVSQNDRLFLDVRYSF